MLDLDITNPSAGQVVCSVAEGLALLVEADKQGISYPKEASEVRLAAGLGLITGKDMPDRLNRALASGDATDKALAVLDGLFRPQDVVELRALSPDGAAPLVLMGRLGVQTERAALRDFIAATNGRRNLYFGVNPRDPKLAGATHAASSADVVARRLIVLDLDFKDAPANDPDWSRTQAELAAMDPRLVVDSGNGVHVYLEVVGETTRQDVAATVGPLAGAMALVGGDNMADPPRIIRLPYTVNLPTATKRARGNVPRLALPRPDGTSLPFKTPKPLPTAQDLAAALSDMASRLSLPGRGGMAASSPSRATATGEEKTPHPAPSADLLLLALAELPNPQGGSFAAREAWVDVAHAVKGAARAGGIEAEGRDAFVLWSQQWGGDPDEPGRVWDGITNPHTGWGWIMRTLQRENPQGRERVRAGEARAAFAQDAARNRAQIMGAPFGPVVSLSVPQIPPRRWLYGRSVIAGFISLLVAPGGAGKSALAMVQAVAMASGRGLLAGEKPVKPLRVWIHNAEDDLQEMQRGLAATLAHFGMTYADLNGNLIMTSGRDMKLQLARTGRDGPEIIPGVVDGLVERLTSAGVDVLILDPLGAFHTLPENSNEAANLLLQALREIAHRADVGMMILHHAGKAAAMDMDAAGAGASRGASAFVDGARIVLQLVRMTEREAARFGIADKDRRDYLRVENGKANLSRAEGARWLLMVDVPLGNGQGLWPHGDRVGVVESWTPPDPASGTATDLAHVQAAIRAAARPLRYSPKSRDWVGYEVARVLGLNVGPVQASQKDRTTEEAAAHARVRALVDGWLRDGGLVRAKGKDPETRHEVEFVAVGQRADLGLGADTSALLIDPDVDAKNAPGDN